MILKTALAIKLLLPLLAAAVGYCFLRRRVSRGRLLGLGALLILSALAAWALSGLVPPLRDQVTLTALGTKNAGASGEEICLSGYTVDGRKYLCGQDMQILDGKWFWKGESFCWRIETDDRQPEGVTRSVTVSVPVGWGRTLNFERGPGCGMVEVSAGGRTWTVDTFSEREGTARADIGRSGTSALICNQIRSLAVYGAVFALLSAAAYTAVVWKRERLARWNARHKGVLVFFAIALAQFLFAVRYSGTDGLWVDELIEIGWSVRMPNLLARAFVDGAPRPIAEFLLGAWIAAAPYGEKWLLLLPEALTAAGVFFTGMCGRELKNVRTGVFAALFTAVSGIVLLQCSYEIRSYSLYFAASAALLWLYIRRYRSGREFTWRQTAVLAAVMVVFSQSHYYAYVFCAGLFLFDAAAHWILKVKRFRLAPYITLGICTVPSAVMVLWSGFLSSFVAEWQPIPDVSAVDSLIDYLLNNSGPLRALLCLGVALSAGALLRCVRPRLREDETDRARALGTVLPAYLTVFVIAFIYIYGNLNTQASLWFNRYFSGLLPCVFVLCAFGADWLCDAAEKAGGKERYAAAACCVFVCLMVLPGAVSAWESASVRVRQPYREAADYIYQDIDYIFSDSSVIIDTSTNPDSALGWDRYYITRYGRRDSLNLVDQLDITEDELLQYDRVYVAYQHDKYGDSLKRTLNKYYTKVSDNADVKVAVYMRK